MKAYGNKTHHVAVIDSATFMLKLFGVHSLCLPTPPIYMRRFVRFCHCPYDVSALTSSKDTRRNVQEVINCYWTFFIISVKS